MRSIAFSILCALTACSDDDPAAPQNPVLSDEVPPAIVALPAASYAGKAADGNTYVAVVTSGNEVIAYACDGNIGHWFRDSVFGLPATLTHADGTTLTIDFLDGGIQGSVLVPNTEPLIFDAKPTTGETSPLFRLEESRAGIDLLGGWVLLPDGTQRGVLNGGAGLKASPAISAVGQIDCAACDFVAAGPALVAANFTPTALGSPRTNIPRRFFYVTFGDSYASGEGSPTQSGIHDDKGKAIRSEFWGNGLPVGVPASLFSDDERARQRDVARACHRSDSAGSMIAADKLQQKFSAVQVVHASFACSGAVAAHIVSRADGGYAGCDEKDGQEKTDCRALTDEDLPEDQPVPPQIQQFDSLVSKLNMTVDAVHMSIGGNDLKFGDIIADCVFPLSDCSLPTSTSRRLLDENVPLMAGKYADVARKFRERGIPAARVFPTLYPNLLQKDPQGGICSREDFTARGDNLLREFEPSESNFAKTVLETMNREFTAGATAAGWTLLNGHVDTSVRDNHSICGTDPYFNHLPNALKVQGHDYPGGGGVFNLSAGMVHPNVAGHRNVYAPVIEAAMTTLITQRFTPAAPTRLRVLRQNQNATITVGWDDKSNIEQAYVITLTRIDGTGTPAAQTITLPPDIQSTTLPTQGAGVWKVDLKATVTNTSATTLSSPVVSINVANRKPAVQPGAPTALEVKTGIRVSIPGAPDPAHMFFTLEKEGFDGGRTSIAVVGNQVEIGAGKRIRVASCNLLGCSPASAFTDLPGQTVQLEVCSGGSVRGPGGQCVPDSRPQPEPGRVPSF